MKLYKVTYEPGWRPGGKYRVGLHVELCTKRSVSARLAERRAVLDSRTRGRRERDPVVVKIEEVEISDDAWQDVTEALLK